MDRRYVLGIDVGIRNLGICVFDFNCAKVVVWDNVPLVPAGGRYIPANNVQYVRDFVKRFQHYFDNAFRVVIERQMRVNMRIIEALLHSQFYDVCTVISARAVKMHYGLSMQNYRANKQRAVEWADSFMSNNACAFADELDLSQYRKAGKRDDMADAMLLVMYYLDTYSTFLQSEE